ncbi:MAG: SGNH/GDSL hydrolase family protein [Acetatifactor sp.]|nr:SGNH/GDSL hydrolase family protein [Acetatifactor sp.]
MEGPKAPKDPTKKRKSFYIMRGKSVAGSPQADGRGIQFLYMNDGRMISSARLVGGITDEEMLKLLETTAGFRQLVHSIGVTVEADDRELVTDFCLQMYGHRDVYGSGTTLRMPVQANGMEHILELEQCAWSEDDNLPGQIRFEFPKAETLATVAVRFYLHDGFDAPEVEEEEPVDFASPCYRQMLEKSLVQTGNNARLKKAIDKARRGEDVTIAFIGGSITQGAGAIPINNECYAYKTFKGFCELTGRGLDDNIHYVKAGVGGTPSELGMIRYEKDVLREGSVAPDVVVVEFAVNDEGDETKGECYDSLVRKILSAENHPAVILLFAVFANDFNLQERLSPVGSAYALPMVSTRDTVVEQFYQTPGSGRVVSKNQFFYDSYHPSNVGHTIMADGILHLLQVVDGQETDADTLKLEETAAPICGGFEKVRLLDRRHSAGQAEIDCGSFEHVDAELQAVEMDMNLTGTPEFADNWMYRGAEKAEDCRPFSMDIICESLLIVYKDSASNQVGCAEVWVDGEKVLYADPHINGWTHCNAQICFRDRERKRYHVEVKLAPGMEDKNFTILGFGVV